METPMPANLSPAEAAYLIGAMAAFCAFAITLSATHVLVNLKR
jgi:hypothetical protein